MIASLKNCKQRNWLHTTRYTHKSPHASYPIVSSKQTQILTATCPMRSWRPSVYTKGVVTRDVSNSKTIQHIDIDPPHIYHPTYQSHGRKRRSGCAHQHLIIAWLFENQYIEALIGGSNNGWKTHHPRDVNIGPKPELERCPNDSGTYHWYMYDHNPLPSNVLSTNRAELTEVWKAHPIPANDRKYYNQRDRLQLVIASRLHPEWCQANKQASMQISHCVLSHSSVSTHISIHTRTS